MAERTDSVSSRQAPVSSEELQKKIVTDLLNLSDAEVPERSNPGDEEKIREEERFFDSAKQQAQLKSLLQDIDLRRKFAWAGYWMNIGWLVLILIIIFFAGFRLLDFRLPDSVLLALIGTTTANVLGVLYIVMRYLFDPGTKKPTKP